MDEDIRIISGLGVGSVQSVNHTEDNTLGQQFPEQNRTADAAVACEGGGSAGAAAAARRAAGVAGHRLR